MSRTVLLDAGPLRMATNPNRFPSNLACTRWLQDLLAAGVRVLVSEIADYEVRRELLRAKKSRGIAKLDALASSVAIFRSRSQPFAKPPNFGPKLASKASPPRAINPWTPTFC